MVVAIVLYETLRDEGINDLAVSRGLHRALRQLRDQDLRDRGTSNAGRDVKVVKPGVRQLGPKNAHWIPYVHFGA